MESIFVESASHGPEFVFIKLEIGHYITLGNIYRSPNSTQTDDTNLCKELESLVSDVLDSKQTTVKTERRLLRQAVGGRPLFQPRKLIVPLRVVYGIKEYLYCYLIQFCNTFDDNNRSVSFGFVEKGYRSFCNEQTMVLVSLFPSTHS